MDFENINDGLDNTQTALDSVADTADRLVSGPVKRLIDNLAKTADGTRSVSDSLERFAEDVLKNLTKKTVEGVFDNVITADGQPTRERGKNSNLFSDLAHQILPSLSGLGNSDVSAQSASGIKVTIHNNAPVVPRVEQKVDSRGQREIEIMIDNMVASSLAQGSQTRSVLQSVFGLTNLLRAR
tara:strand:+ start:839 stop:1387 length:549 start_codon:yes stop_codon:yes gene_type:complete